jgi:hypothetical protein
MRLAAAAGAASHVAGALVIGVVVYVVIERKIMMFYLLKFKQVATTALHWLFDYLFVRPVDGLVAVVQGLELVVPPVVRAVGMAVVEQLTPGERVQLQVGAGMLMQGLGLLVGPLLAVLVVGYGGVLAVGLVGALVLMLLPCRGSPLVVRG